VSPTYIQNAIKEARSSVDFFVALTYLSALLSIAALLISASEHFELSVLTVCIAAIVMAMLCHWLAVRATSEWGYTVQALVNIGRVKLANSMGLELPDNLGEEKEMWGLVTRYGFFCDEEDAARLDNFRKRPKAEAQSAMANDGSSLQSEIAKVDASSEEDDEGSGADEE
jgi:hypothetical protein